MMKRLTLAAALAATLFVSADERPLTEISLASYQGAAIPWGWRTTVARSDGRVHTLLLQVEDREGEETLIHEHARELSQEEWDALVKVVVDGKLDEWTPGRCEAFPECPERRFRMSGAFTQDQKWTGTPTNPAITALENLLEQYATPLREKELARQKEAAGR